MKITCVNRSTNPVPMPGAVSCAAGATKFVTSRTVDEAAQMTEQYAGSAVEIFVELEAEDYPPILAVAKTPADPAGGVDTLAGVGFDLKTLDGNAVAYQPTMYLGVFSDAACTTPSTTATLDTATAGTIVSGGGTNLLEVTPSATGEFACSVDDTADEAVYLKAWVAGSRRIVDTSDQHTVTFTA